MAKLYVLKGNCSPVLSESRTLHGECSRGAGRGLLEGVIMLHFEIELVRSVDDVEILRY